MKLSNLPVSQRHNHLTQIWIQISKQTYYSQELQIKPINEEMLNEKPSNLNLLIPVLGEELKLVDEK